MTRPLLVLRPEPGASATAARANAHGLVARIAPLFHVEAVAWDPPPAAGFDALMLTSAHAVRHAGPALAGYRALPLYVVGEATADAARNVGYPPLWTGRSDAQQLLEAAADAGVHSMLHLCGREHRHVSNPAVLVDRRVVYAAQAAAALGDEARDALASGAVALLHSPRAAGIFAGLVAKAGLERGHIAIAALSPAVAKAAGAGWAALGVAAAPRDDALLAVAARMCE